MSETTPTVVLVHGAFADGSSWNGVIERLQAKGIRVTAPSNPLRGIASDTARLRHSLRAGGTRDTRRRRGGVEGQHPEYRACPTAVPDRRRRIGDRVLHRPGQGP